VAVRTCPYVYGNAGFHHALTDIIDESGNAYASRAYAIATAWLRNFHLLTRVTKPGRVAHFSYDPNGNLLLL
jgi:hypothetical protein